MVRPIGGVEVQLYYFLITTIEWGEGSASRPDPLYPRKRPSTHCTGGWVGPRSGLDRCGKSRPHWDSIPGPSSPQPVAIQTELPGPTYARVIYAILIGCGLFNDTLNKSFCKAQMAELPANSVKVSEYITKFTYVFQSATTNFINVASTSSIFQSY